MPARNARKETKARKGKAFPKCCQKNLAARKIPYARDETAIELTSRRAEVNTDSLLYEKLQGRCAPHIFGYSPVGAPVPGLAFPSFAPGRQACQGRL
jgi:hypothetical protein